MNKKKDRSLSGFGKGWGIILYCLLMFWFYAGMVNDSTNIVAPAVAAKLGLAAGDVVSMGTVAGLVGVLFFFVVGWINRKLGARYTSAICLVIAGAGYFCMGRANSLAAYGVALCAVTIGAMSAGYLSGGALVAQWFPKKKGIVMGYTTMGHNLATGLFVPLITALVTVLGVERGVVLPAVLIVVLAMVGLIFVRNTPQERGINPDNVSDERYEKEYFTDQIDKDGGWTVKKLLTTKDFWLSAITTGTFQMVSAIIITQLVIRNQELGFTQAQAVSIMTILAFAGVVGSWLIGVLDQKLGTKRTMIFFGLWYIVTLLFNFTEVKPLIYVFLVMFAVALGGSANFTTSLPAAVFGRHGFEKVNSILFPIQALCTSMSFAINGVVQNVTGGLRWTYLIAAIICAVNIVLVCFVNEHRYNRDYQKESNTTV